jgi:polyisoprenoid-binding protein YceI
MENNASPEHPPAQVAGIDLDIAGQDLLLSGRFTDWESGVSMGPDLDQLQIRLAIDATSATAGADRRSDPALFCFRGRDAALIGAGVYQIDGELTGAAGARPLQARVETPVEHSAVFLLSFQANKSDFGARWTELLSNVISFRPRHDGPSMPAHAWLTVPGLAAA